ncbi:hypothetical protein, partial [Methylobacterium segetis]
KAAQHNKKNIRRFVPEFSRLLSPRRGERFHIDSINDVRSELGNWRLDSGHGFTVRGWGFSERTASEQLDIVIRLQGARASVVPFSRSRFPRLDVNLLHGLPEDYESGLEYQFSGSRIAPGRHEFVVEFRKDGNLLRSMRIGQIAVGV